ncbi:LysE family translocator [Celeribacter litoreus]|uniref:LysE family translocator n=1 Tax=Celeribacter litoreus TaxID=2876714 RepID=UPI001CCBE107|nr:LysE family translocator [Celeribacter litoreus]MCA0044403.1 LysE family translocator [Celeribacter litoreus]
MFGDGLWAFILASFAIEATPGPNMAYLIVLAATEGRRAGYAAVAGVALGLLIVGLLSALGLAALISASPVLFQALRWAGVVYLLWLAYDAWRPERPEENAFRSKNARYFRRGLIVNLLNPKAAVFYIAMLPQFVSREAAILTQTITLSLVYVAVATVVHASLVTLADMAHGTLTDPVRRKIVRRAMACTLVAIAAWFAFETA